MALTESTMITLGSTAPDFTLADTVSGRPVSLDDGHSYEGTLLLFICNHCPFVVHVADELARLGKDLQDRGLRVLAISSNDVDNYPADHPDLMTEEAAARGYTFPYLYDETQEVARAYDAACTPDIYLYDGDMKLYYRGRLDGSRPGNGVPVDARELRSAVDAMLHGEAPPADQYPSAGCNIKWK